MSNSNEEPNFFDNEEEEIDEKDEKSKKDNKNLNISFDDEIEKEEISKNVTISMVENDKKQKNSKKNNLIENRILKNIESDEEEEENKSKKSKSFIKQSDDDDEKDNEEPNFYNEEENGENISENEMNSDDNEEEEDNNNSEKEGKKEDKYLEKNKKKKEELKKKNIVIENIYEINKEFNYNIDNPVFYLKENKCALDKYPWPMSTKQIVKLIEKDNILYENLKVKLVDLFEFKLRNAFEYVDFIDVIKPEWTDNITYSKIFLDLHNFKIKKEKENNNDKNKDIDKDKNKDKEMEKDKTSMIQISQSVIPKIAESNTFSMEKKFLDKFKENKNENENEKPDNKKKNYWPRNKNKFKKGRKKAVEIKGGFSYE